LQATLELIEATQAVAGLLAHRLSPDNWIRGVISGEPLHYYKVVGCATQNIYNDP